VVTSSDAYAVCARLARDHYENFPVASWLLPAEMRPHVAAVYAYARLADDIADEGDAPATLREARLDEWVARLHAAVDGTVIPPTPTSLEPGMAEKTPAIFTAVGESVRSLDLPITAFEDLVSAFRQDVTVTRYDTWAEVLDYCRRSANPVGRLVLRIGGWRDEALDQSSDALCSALQLTNFWQDLAGDWTRGRLYVPREEWSREPADLADLDGGRLTPAWRDVLAGCAMRTRELFDRGRLVCDAVSGRLRWELRLTWLGGMRVLERLDAPGFDLLRERPALGARDLPSLVGSALRWPT
jgi:hydroxysqualene synthase